MKIKTISRFTRSVLAFALVLVLVLVLATANLGTVASALEAPSVGRGEKSYNDALLLEAAADVIDAYRVHYIISDTVINGIAEHEKEDGGFYVDYFIDMTMRLKYDNATELPQIRGLSSALGIDCSKLTTAEFTQALTSKNVKNALAEDVLPVAMNTLQQIATTEKTRPASDMFQANSVMLSQETIADAIVDKVTSDTIEFVKDLETEYIGNDNTVSVGLRLVFDVSGNIVDILYEVNDIYYEDISHVTPKPDTDMISIGQQQAQHYIAAAADFIVSTASGAEVATASANGTAYKRVTARNYADTYTSNATTLCSCSTCTHTGPCVRQNPSKYNKSYSSYCCNDCANFVSQAFLAGGIKTDGYWYKNSTPWSGTLSMEHYFTHDSVAVNRGYPVPENMWVESNAAYCNAGGVIMLYNSLGGYHVMMCVKNDTENRAFSAHTTDRRQCAYNVDEIFDDDALYVRYFVFANSVTE